MPQRRLRASRPGFTVDVSYDAWIAVIAVGGEIDLAAVPRLRAVVDEAAGTGHDVLVDLTGCPFLDSSGAAQVLRAQRLAHGQDAAFAIVCPAGGIPDRVLEIVCAGELPVHRTRAEALAVMRRVALDIGDPPPDVVDEA